MCDTLGFVYGKRAVFGKNSDRSPNEPQLLEYIPAAYHNEKEIKLTYISIPQSAETHGVLISRPGWMWGAEIGTNDCGVSIGNEAVWTLGGYGGEALTGMDMLRLALERSESAETAVDTVISLLETYGQGGNCGYDHDFRYDNSFLIMDRNSLYVLETAGKQWAVKKCGRASISNRLSLTSNADRFSEGRCNFALRHSEHLYNIASGSRKRACSTESALESAGGPLDIMNALRGHTVDNPFARGTVTSVCMHFGGAVGDHTTSSMVTDYTGDKTVVWSTGSSLPCVSLFKPWVFGESIPSYFNCGSGYWYAQEKFRRKLLGKEIPGEFFDERDEIERSWADRIEKGETGITEECLKEEKAFYDRWSDYEFGDAGTSVAFRKRWDAKTEIMMRESEETE